MHRMLLLIALVNLVAMTPQTLLAQGVSAEDYGFTAEDWPWWRGPNRNGIAHADQQPPTQWSETTNIRWKTQIPGRGHGSPIVVKDRVYIAAADKNSHWVFCFDSRTGKILWKHQVHDGGVYQKGNKKASQASMTLAHDGDRLFANFLHDNVVYTTCLGANGVMNWRKRISDYIVHQGFSSSPAIYGELVIVTADNKGGGAVVAIERTSGREIWRHDRPKLPNYPSPIILHAAGKDQLFLTGCELVTSLDPLTGKVNWEIEGATTECVTSTVTDGTILLTSGGYPKNHMAAVKADGSGEIVWENQNRIYVPSMLISDGYIYGVLDAGVAGCWEAATGKEMWKKRIGGVFSSSPVLINGHIYVTNEVGITVIFEANPQKFKFVAKNELGEEVFATPVFVSNQIFTRIAYGEGDGRQEYLVCIGE